MEAKATFAKRFTELCSDKTQQEIAEAIGVSRATIGYYLNGDRSPDIDVLSRISNYFSVTSDYLIGLSDAKQAENTDIVERLGLSEKTIELLVYNNAESKRSYSHEYYQYGCTPIKLIDSLYLAILEDFNLMENLIEVCTLMKSARTDKYKNNEFLCSQKNDFLLEFESKVHEGGYRVISGYELVELYRFRLTQSIDRAVSAAIAEYETEYNNYLLDDEISERISFLHARIEELKDFNEECYVSFCTAVSEAANDPNASKEQIIKKLKDILLSVSLELKKHLICKNSAGEPDADNQ